MMITHNLSSTAKHVPKLIVERLVLARSNVDDTVSYSFCGIGTTPLCCQTRKGNCYAFEINPVFVTRAKNRMRKQEDKKQRLVAEEDFKGAFAKVGMGIYGKISGYDFLI